jgi:hypothetical protein
MRRDLSSSGVSSGVVGRSFLGLALAVPLVLTSCTMKPEPSAPFEILVKVSSDPGHPLPGAIIMKGGKEGPTTGADGQVSVKIGGQEGESVDLMVKCPADYVSPIHAISVLLRRNSGTKLAEYEANCPPAIRHMVIAVRADNGANLPVKVLGHTIGYTDANGAFTYALPLRPGDGVEVMLDTSAYPRMSPQNPSSLLTMKPFDDVVTFDQKFQIAPPPPKVYAKRQVPIAIKGPHRGFP